MGAGGVGGPGVQGVSPELEGVAQAEVEDLGVWGVRGLTRHTVTKMDLEKRQKQN